MDHGEATTAFGDDEPGVLGRLPATRPQHRSGRRAASSGAGSARGGSAARRSAASASDVPAPAAAVAADAAVGPAIPPPPAAPRSGWATPEPTPDGAALPPLAAVVDGALRTGEQLVRGVLRRLPFG